MEAIIVIGVIIAIVVVVVVLYQLFRPSQIVPEDRRLVIYRDGRFDRIVGPGRVRLSSGRDEVKKEIEVRDHPDEISIPGIMAYGVPNDFTLNLWYKVDLEEAVDGDKAKLVHLVQITEAERGQQVQILVRQALINQVSRLQQEKPLPPEANDLMAGVAALAPGTPLNTQLLEGITVELIKTLPTVGVILNTDYPIALIGRGIPQEMIDALKRKRGRELDSDWLKKYAADLRQQFPEISNAVVAQMLASIDGIDLSNVQGLLLEQEADSEAQIKLKMPADGTPATPTVSIVPPTRPVQTEATDQGQLHHAATSHRLTRQDLDVLKPIPRSDNDRRKSA
jgi:hypothetical protein